MRFFFDECVSANLAVEISVELEVQILNPRDENVRGATDHEIAQMCINNELIIVTKNGRDFIEILGMEESHPGLIVLPGNEPRAKCRNLLLAVIKWLRINPEGLLENNFLKVYKDGNWELRA